ncbi:MAG: hypothetical protein M1829_003092 [Trizodia sp. TS-e1964]|nr:MAG: hypothetical protein M1829_003092 [Trizodia sp. TS-e1964]
MDHYYFAKARTFEWIQSVPLYQPPHSSDQSPEPFMEDLDNLFAHGKSALRFSDIPPVIDVPFLQGAEDDTEQAVEVNLNELQDDPTELCLLLKDERASKNLWMTISLAYAKQDKLDNAIETVLKGLEAYAGASKERIPLLTFLCWLYIRKAREASRVPPENNTDPDFRTKDYYIQATTSPMNEAMRLNPSFPPLYMARGVIYLFRASLLPASQTSSGPGMRGSQGSQESSERQETLRSAIRCFEDASRVSSGRNMMAICGKSRALYAMGSYAKALEGYQEVVRRCPTFVDPDPRIGIGYCFWQLGNRDLAVKAWLRVLELNPDSKVATVLVAVYNLSEVSGLPSRDQLYQETYLKAMGDVANALRLDSSFPLACATLAGHLAPRKNRAKVELLARKAIEKSDVSAIISDSWFALARMEHDQENYEKASEYYRKADEARGGVERGYMPARLCLAQLQILAGDRDGAKFRLEKLIQTSKTRETMTLLGMLLAEEVFAHRGSVDFKEEKFAELKRACSLLEGVRLMWKDPKRQVQPDTRLLAALSQLYEVESPEKALQCLKQYEDIEVDLIPPENRPKNIEDPDLLRKALRELLPPQMTNNMGCYYYRLKNYPKAKEMFQSALNATVIIEKDDTIDADAIVITASYNLARTLEHEGNPAEVLEYYQGLLERHPEYTDASARIAQIKLQEYPLDEGPKAITALYQKNPGDLEVRALYGWYLGKSKKRVSNMQEDPELRHYKHTLQQYDKKDSYSLTGMGNICLSNAREMKRETEADREKKRVMYGKAVEFFHKALILDLKNAYAAQGVAIALSEDRKDHYRAIQILTKVRETLGDSSVFVNLGHIYAELKQHSRAIEHYEQALSMDRAEDPDVLGCLARVHLQKGKVEKNLEIMKEALALSQKAFKFAPVSQIHFKFNIAFVQFQIAALIYTLPEAQRTLPDLLKAAEDLEEAIEAFTQIAQSPTAPYPKNDLEQRANMGRNTMRKQLERAIQSQRDYESRNAEKLQRARAQREAELKRRELAAAEAAAALQERKRILAEERRKMAEEDRARAEAREAEELARAIKDLTTDEETGEKRKRVKKRGGAGKRKKREDGAASDEEKEEAEGKERGVKKRRTLERRAQAQSKFKSSEIVVESDSDADAAGPTPPLSPKSDEGESPDAASAAGASPAAMSVDSPVDAVPGGEEEQEREEDASDDASEDEAVAVTRRSRRKAAPLALADEDDEDEREVAGSAGVMDVEAGDTSMHDIEDGEQDREQDEE